jgi:hypothetical protein
MGIHIVLIYSNLKMGCALYQYTESKLSTLAYLEYTVRACVIFKWQEDYDEWMHMLH